jgi:hypothetical protein
VDGEFSGSCDNVPKSFGPHVTSPSTSDPSRVRLHVFVCARKADKIRVAEPDQQRAFSLARTSTEVGISRPIALTVLRLTTSLAAARNFDSALVRSGSGRPFRPGTRLHVIAAALRKRP